MVGETSRPEDRQGASGRPRRRCFGGRRGVENEPISLWKRGRLAMLNSTAFSVFVPARKDIFSEDQNCIDETCHWEMTSQSSTLFQLLEETFQRN